MMSGQRISAGPAREKTRNTFRLVLTRRRPSVSSGNWEELTATGSKRAPLTNAPAAPVVVLTSSPDSQAGDRMDWPPPARDHRSPLNLALHSLPTLLEGRRRSRAADHRTRVV